MEAGWPISTFKGDKMKKILLLILLASVSAEAAPLKRLFQDVKLPTQQVLERQTVPAPLLAATNYIVTTNAGPTSGAAFSITSFAHQPDVPRNLTITPTGTTADVASCTITVTGTDYNSHTISEDFAFLATASTATTGAKAFKTVASVSFPPNCEGGGFGATWIVGTGSKLGLKHCMANAGDVFHANFNGASETVGTVAANATSVSGNTYTPTGTMNGAKDVIVDFVQNFGCF